MKPRVVSSSHHDNDHAEGTPPRDPCEEASGSRTTCNSIYDNLNSVDSSQHSHGGAPVAAASCPALLVEEPYTQSGVSPLPVQVSLGGSCLGELFQPCADEEYVQLTATPRTAGGSESDPQGPPHIPDTFSTDSSRAHANGASPRDPSEADELGEKPARTRAKRRGVPRGRRGKRGPLDEVEGVTRGC